MGDNDGNRHNDSNSKDWKKNLSCNLLSRECMLECDREKEDGRDHPDIDKPRKDFVSPSKNNVHVPCDVRCSPEPECTGGIKQAILSSGAVIQVRKNKCACDCRNNLEIVADRKKRT